MGLEATNTIASSRAGTGTVVEGVVCARPPVNRVLCPDAAAQSTAFHVIFRLNESQGVSVLGIGENEANLTISLYNGFYIQ